MKTNITLTAIFSFILLSCDNRTCNGNETRPKMNSSREIQSSSEYVCAVLKQRHAGFARRSLTRTREYQPRWKKNMYLWNIAWKISLRLEPCLVTPKPHAPFCMCSVTSTSSSITNIQDMCNNRIIFEFVKH